VSSYPRALHAPLSVLVGFALASLGGCVYEQEGPPEAHFEQFSTKPPKADTVTVCHAYGCKAQTPFAFTPSDIAEISAVMTRVRRDESPREERRAIAYAIAWMERRVAPTVGTASDRPSMDFLGSGDESQQDCVDEATNTTSYLLVLERNGLIKHHSVEQPFAKDDLSHWTHWAAVIREKESEERFAIDSSSGPNGENPTVQAAASFYIPDNWRDQTPPETSGPATANAAGDGAAPISLSYGQNYLGSVP
jgi:hypothetical protein